MKLGIAKMATLEGFRKTWRMLAKPLHPDLRPDEPVKQDEAQAVSAAYDLLRDLEKCRRFNADAINASGQKRRDASIALSMLIKMPTIAIAGATAGKTMGAASLTDCIFHTESELWMLSLASPQVHRHVDFGYRIFVSWHPFGFHLSDS